MRAICLVWLAACGLELGPSAEWTATDSIGGELAPETGSPRGMPMAPLGSGLPFRIVTFNVATGADPAALAREILANTQLAGAGAFLIQEEEDYPGEGATRASRLATELGTGWVYVPGRIKHDGTHGLAIMSRHPIENVEVMPLPLTSKGQQRIAIRADLLVGETRLQVVNVHLETRINIGDRILHLRPAILDLPERVIVAGDVNTNPYLWEDGAVPLVSTAQIVDTDQAPLLDGYMRGLGFATPAANVGPTERMYGIESRLDAIYTRGFAVSEARVERTVAGSDHWPVWVDVTLP